MNFILTQAGLDKIMAKTGESKEVVIEAAKLAGYEVESFEPVASCMHCGLPVDADARDSKGSLDCFDEYDDTILGVHDYDIEYNI